MPVSTYFETGLVVTPTLVSSAVALLDLSHGLGKGKRALFSSNFNPSVQLLAIIYIIYI